MPTDFLRESLLKRKLKLLVQAFYLPCFAMYNVLPCITCTYILCALYTGLLCPWYVIIIPIYNVQPYISLKNVGKKNAYYTQQNTVSFSNCVNKKRKQKRKIFGYIQQVGENLANC